MASISGTNSSLGNTSLRGYGGWASGIDRDAIIEQMTMGTQSKINNQKSDITKLQWKQEAYRSVSDKILDLIDNHFSYSSSKNLKDASVFSKNKITTLGNSDFSKFVSASGTSALSDYLSILGVRRLASAATMQSREMAAGSNSILTSITNGNLNETVNTVSNLAGTRLVFGNYDTEGRFKEAGTFTFPTSYKDADGNTVNIDYSKPPRELVADLNKALESSEFKLGEEGKIEFGYNEATGGITITGKDGAENYTINHTTSSTALKALGFQLDGLTEDQIKDGISLDEFNANTSNTENSYITKQNWIDYLKDKEVSITYGGQTRTIKLLKSSDIEKLGKIDGKYVLEDTVDADGNMQTGLKTIIQDNLDRAFGSGKVNLDVTGGKLEIGSDSNVTVTSNDAMLLKNLGIEKNASNKISLDSSIKANVSKLVPSGMTEDEFLDKLRDEGLVINGIKIDGITEDTTINEMMKKINETPEAGVKATYMASTNQFVLVASETGSGRDISLGGAAEDLFGGTATSGEDAEIEVSYGNGITTTIKSSTNTFNLEGLDVTVSGTFGYKEDGTLDSSQAVTFSSAADVEGVTETVKKFIEDYNALIKEINSQVTTKPNKSYGPLTEEQKKEMSEKSIENWEEQAKKGLLFNDAAMRDLSLDMQGILSKIMQSGIKYEDLENIGITMSEDGKDGGTLIFDENKFKEAMNSDPKLVSDIFTGGDSGKKGMAQIMEETLSRYATRYATKYGNSNGRLIEEAGSNKIPSSLSNNQIYKQLQDMEEKLKTFQSRLESERDRYISQFTTMETLISKMNAQSSYLSSMNA